MLILPNGHSYKLVYLDTNIINEIAKNTNFTGRNFLLNYANGEYAFVTSVFNIYELSRAKGKSYDAVTRFFDVLPLLVGSTYPQLIEFEKIAPQFQDAISEMYKNFKKELVVWEMDRKSAHPNWMQNFEECLLASMNNSFRLSRNYFPISHLGQYKSLEIYSFIKNQFIHSTNKPITLNSIIDAYNASFLPYTDIYVTERTVGSWLEASAKRKFDYIQDVEIVKLSMLYD